MEAWTPVPAYAFGVTVSRNRSLAGRRWDGRCGMAGLGGRTAHPGAPSGTDTYRVFGFHVR